MTILHAKRTTRFLNPRAAYAVALGLVVAAASAGAAVSPPSSQWRSVVMPAPSFAPFATDVHEMILARGDRMPDVCDASNLPGIGFVEFDSAPIERPAPPNYCTP